MNYSEHAKKRFSDEVENINKIDDEDTRMQMKLKLMADMINEYSNINPQ